MLYICILMGPLQGVHLFFAQSFSLVPFSYASSKWFPFLSVTSVTKLERLHRVASRAITGCLSSSLISLLLTEASPVPLLVTLAHFALSSYERTLRLPTFFPIWFGQTWSETKSL